nr:hypothetical protein [Tanacetum cinerariifolium]
MKPTLVVKKCKLKVSRQKVGNLNSFDALNSIENDDKLGTNRGDSSLAGKGVASSSTGSTPIAKRIDKFERQLTGEKLLLVDDDEKPLPKV